MPAPDIIPVCKTLPSRWVLTRGRARWLGQPRVRKADSLVFWGWLRLTAAKLRLYHQTGVRHL